jgi:hypothetical protein
MPYILEVQKFNPTGHLLQSEWNGKSTHVGYMNKVFKTKNQACEYYDNNNNTMRPLNSHHTYRSDWNRDTHLLYVVREYGDEYLSIPPFEEKEKGKDLVIEQFIADNIEHVPGGHIGKKMLNNVFKEWFQMNFSGRKMPKLMEIEMAMNEKFEVKTNKYGLKEWINVNIKCNDCDLDDALDDI